MQDQKKSYVYLKTSHKEFKVSDHVYLREKLRKRSLELWSFVNLALRYCRPFELLDRIEIIAYRIEFPINMRAHNFFHVSLLKKYVCNHNHVIDWNVIQVDPKVEFQRILYASLNERKLFSAIEPSAR